MCMRCVRRRCRRRLRRVVVAGRLVLAAECRVRVFCRVCPRLVSCVVCRPCLRAVLLFVLFGTLTGTHLLLRHGEPWALDP